jgi:hypothetical protein
LDTSISLTIQKPIRRNVPLQSGRNHNCPLSVGLVSVRGLDKSSPYKFKCGLMNQAPTLKVQPLFVVNISPFDREQETDQRGNKFYSISREKSIAGAE